MLAASHRRPRRIGRTRPHRSAIRPNSRFAGACTAEYSPTMIPIVTRSAPRDLAYSAMIGTIAFESIVPRRVAERSFTVPDRAIGLSKPARGKRVRARAQPNPDDLRTPGGTFTSRRRVVRAVAAPLYVDANEPPEIADLLRGLGVEVERRKIAPGDYVCGEVGIERKTVSDFFGSLVKKRLFEQLRRLRESYPVALMILEGDPQEISKFKSPHAILGAIVAIEVDERVPILTTADR